MGCACTRAANGEKSRNDSSQSESAKKYTKEDSGGFGPSHGGGGGDRGATGGDVGSEAHKAPLIADEAQSAPAAPSGPGSGGKQHGPMSKFINNIFDRKKTISSDQDGSSSHLLSSRIASPNTPLLDVSHDRSMPSLIDMKSHSGGTAATTSANTTTTSGVGVGATTQRGGGGGGGGGRLPQNTLNLICGLSELERKPTSMEQAALAASSSSHVSSNKLNREIQSYMSLPYTDGARSLIPPANADATVIYTLKFIERHLNSTEPIDSSSDSTSVYDSLRQYCAQKTRNCDFTVVNLNYYASAATTGSFSSSSPSRAAALSSSAATAAAASATNPGSLLAGAFHLAANKYFRRALTRLILSDLVNNNYISTPTSPIDVGFKRNVNYMAPNGLFIIFLSEPQIEQESVDDLLCPERIDLADFKSHLDKKMSKHDHELFAKWYKPVESADGGAYYRLDIDFNAAASTHAQKSLNEELGKLTRIFYAHLDDGSETTEHHGAASSLRLKYLKSVQQDELELISRHADANMIIWIHLVGAPSTASTDHDRLNKARYALIFDLLKDKVLNHNYKQIRIGMVDSASENFSLRQHLTAVNEFLFNSIKLLVDAVTLDLDKSAISMMAIRMDKHLGLEITKHYNYYKYLRLCSPAPASTPSSTGAIATSTVLQQVENKLTSILNDYISESNSRTPLMIYNSDTNTGVSGVGDETASSYFDRFTSKWIGRLIETNSKTNADYKKLIVYRFCNHTILASEVLTLLQSIVHQLCFILGVHESLAFESPAKIVENLSKSLGKFFSKNENKQKQIVIVLNGLDRCLKTPYDVNLVVSFVNKIFGTDTWPVGSVKLVMTLSINSPTSMSTQKLVASLQKKLDSQFTQKPTCKLNFDAGSRRSSLAAATSVLAGATASSWPSLNDHLTSLLFGSAPAGSGGTNDNLAHQLVDLLVYFLSETRYGVKQSEIGDLFRTAVAAANGNAMSQLDPALRSYMLDTAWFTMKYYGRLFASSACTIPPSLITLCTDQSQALFKLAVANLGTSYQPRKANKSSKIDEIIYSYYNRSVSSNTGKAATLEAEKALLRYVSHFNTRIFHELPKCFYLSDSADPQEDQAYINEFILNPKWLLNKSYTCLSVLYYLHDLVSYRKLFMAGSSADSEIDEAASSPTDATVPAFTAEEVANMSSKKKFVRFERVVYKCLFNLSQDHNQLGYFVKSLGVEPLLTNANYLAVKAGNAPRLLPLNFSYFKLKDDAKSTCLLEQDNRELVYFTKVVFIQRGIFLTLSDAPYNLIKIWKVEQNEPIRTIKLNKSPKDIRLINHHTGIVLIERNLHLIDLNMCEHIYDLNSTMNPSFALFELHDYNHLVLLARNRLSVILMKVPHITTTSSSSGETTDSRKNSIVPVSPPPIETNPAVGGKLTVAKDDMFLFKVGEDRYLKSLVVSRNGKIMVCGDEVQKPFPLLVWNLNQRKLVYDLRQPNHEIIVSVQAISSSGRFFVSACQEEGEIKNCLIVYDLSTGQLFKKLKAKSDYICVDVSEECDVIIAGLDNSQIVVYDLSTGSKRFSINSNKYPINKIKLVDAWNKQLKNYFLTYDTTGSDWTIRLWDLQAGDQLISSITMPARLISLDINTSPYYLEQSTATTITPTATPTPTPQPLPQPANNEQIDHEILLAVSVYGVPDALLVKLDVPNAKAIYQVKASHEHFSNNDAALNALVKEINL